MFTNWPKSATITANLMGLVEKIVSGGQTGADRAALDFAIEHGIPHGCWWPSLGRNKSAQVVRAGNGPVCGTKPNCHEHDHKSRGGEASHNRPASSCTDGGTRMAIHSPACLRGYWEYPADMNAWTSTVLCVACLLCQGSDRTEAAPPPSSSGTVRVLVACYSLTGNTQKMATGVVEGVKRVSGAAVTIKKVEEVAKEVHDTAGPRD